MTVCHAYGVGGAFHNEVCNSQKKNARGGELLLADDYLADRRARVRLDEDHDAAAVLRLERERELADQRERLVGEAEDHDVVLLDHAVAPELHPRHRRLDRLDEEAEHRREVEHTEQRRAERPEPHDPALERRVHAVVVVGRVLERTDLRVRAGVGRERPHLPDRLLEEHVTLRPVEPREVPREARRGVARRGERRPLAVMERQSGREIVGRRTTAARVARVIVCVSSAIAP